MQLFGGDLFQVEGNAAQNCDYVELVVVVVETDIEILENKFSELVANENLLEVKDFLYDVGLEQD